MSAERKHPRPRGYLAARRSVQADDSAAGPHDPDPSNGSRPLADEDRTSTDEVLDVPAVAQLLQVGRNTVYELVGRNEIPHRRLRKKIRFTRAAIMQWLSSWSPQVAKKGH